LVIGYHQLSLDLNTPHRLEATAATALLIVRAAVDTIGYLDERFFLYGEDLDWLPAS
jgi:GT2 family glycosyltransferase